MQGGNRRAGRWLDGLPGRGVLATAIVAAAVAVLPARAHGAPEPLDPSAPVTLVAVERRADGSLDVDRYRADDLEQAAAIDTVLRSHDETLSVGVDVPVTLQATADPMSADQWALTATTFTSAWSATQGGSVKVAVIDTGVRGDHEDLQGAVLSGRDYVQPGGDGRVDPGGHGTHVAGIVAARVNNGRGIAGAAPKARILPVRVLDGNGAGHASNVVDGIIWAADQGAKVINLSLGTGSPFEPFRTAIQYARSKGAVVVVAAGNSALTGNQPVYPAAYPEAIAVGAVDRQLRRAPYSNYGSYVDLAAPGDAIVSTYGSGSKAYAWASGTSMATPYAAAAFALVAAKHPDYSAGQLRAAVEGSARDLGSAGPDTSFGHGLVDPARAVWTVPDSAKQGAGYWVVEADGRVRAFGGAKHLGGASNLAKTAPVVAGAPTATGKGYWLTTADGAVFSFGDAKFSGSMYGKRLNAPIVGMAPTPDGKGYYLLGADGGIFTFGKAKFHGSTGNLRLNAPVIDMAVTSTGKGYWLVARDGGIFTFGDARFYGSTGNLRLAQPVVSMTSAANAKGYWLIARDGGVFTFKVPFLGSIPSLGMTATANNVRVRALPDGSGYYVLATNGSVYTFGYARYHGAAPAGLAVDLMLVPG